MIRKIIIATKTIIAITVSVVYLFVYPFAYSYIFTTLSFMFLVFTTILTDDMLTILQ